MGDIDQSNTELTVIVHDKYLKTNFYPIDIYTNADELFIGAVKYLMDSGKSCEFLGFNDLGEHVVVIDGIKYCTENVISVEIGEFSFTNGKSVYDPSSLSYQTFFVVEDVQHDYITNFLNNRVKKILDNI